MAGKDAGAGGNFGSESLGKGSGRTSIGGGDGNRGGQARRQQLYPGILQGERIPEYRQRQAKD